MTSVPLMQRSGLSIRLVAVVALLFAGCSDRGPSPENEAWKVVGDRSGRLPSDVRNDLAEFVDDWRLAVLSGAEDLGVGTLESSFNGRLRQIVGLRTEPDIVAQFWAGWMLRCLGVSALYPKGESAFTLRQKPGPGSGYLEVVFREREEGGTQGPVLEIPLEDSGGRRAFGGVPLPYSEADAFFAYWYWAVGRDSVLDALGRGPSVRLNFLEVLPTRIPKGVHITAIVTVDDDPDPTGVNVVFLNQDWSWEVDSIER